MRRRSSRSSSGSSNRLPGRLALFPRRAAGWGTSTTGTIAGAAGWPLPSHSARRMIAPRALRWIVRLQGVGVHVHARRQVDVVAVDAGRQQLRGDGRRRHQHPADAELAEGRQVIVSEGVRTEGASHVAIAGVPERQGIPEAGTDDDFAAGPERFDVPHAPPLVRQVHVQGRALAKIVSRLAPVDVHDLAAAIGGRDREHDAAVHVLVAAAAEQAELLQPGADFLAGLGIHRRQLEAQRAIGVADPESVDGLAHGDATAAQIIQALGGFLERAVVVVDDLGQQLLIVELRIEQRCRASESCPCWHPPMAQEKGNVELLLLLKPRPRGTEEQRAADVPFRGTRHTHCSFCKNPCGFKLVVLPEAVCSFPRSAWGRP